MLNRIMSSLVEKRVKKDNIMANAATEEAESGALGGMTPGDPLFDKYFKLSNQMNSNEL